MVKNSGHSQRIAGRFEIRDPEKDLLGRGGMGTVYRATDTLTGQLVAVKTLDPTVVARDPEILERFVREGEALRQLNHPNIVRMIAAVEEAGQHYLIMEYVEGGSLRDILEKEERLPAQRVMEIALELADALTRAHHLGILHRDLKPENVLLVADGTPRLADFGLARLGTGPRLTQSGMLMGTVDYISPEACQGEAPDERSDIWSFGVMLFEMLAGCVPFAGDTLVAKLNAILTQPVPDLRQLVLDTPAGLVELVMRMLVKEPQQRIPSVRMVGAELEAIVKGHGPITPLPVTPDPSATAPKHNLPTQLSTFIGREKEIAQLKRRLGEYRLVTLTGSGGIGKTRLAIQTARESLPRFHHGAWLVELAPLARPELVPGAVATVLGVRDSQERPVLDALTDYLREKAALLVLDNCEHVIDACAQLTEHLLQHCPEVRILASSREALGIEGEMAVRVPSLSLPPAERVSHETQEQSEAVRLFVERAAAALPGFKLTEANAPAVVQVCHRLDGVALAIELAAARVRLLKVEQIAVRLDDAFRLLTGGSRTALPRQQTLRATVDWSHNLLAEDERTLLRRLSVFAGGWTLEAAEAVCAGDGAAIRDVLDVLNLLTQLVNKSLVMVERRQSEEARYHLMETTRQYAREKLVESGEGEAVRGRHLDYYSDLAERLEWQLRTSEQATGWRQATAELDNVRTALEWSFEEARMMEVEKGLRLASALEDIWDENARTRTEGSIWLQQGLALLAMDGRPESALIRAKALRVTGHLAVNEGMDQTGRAMLEESVALYRAANLADKCNLVLAVTQLAYAWLNNDLTAARPLTEESVAIGRKLGPSGRWDLAHALYWDGVVACRQGDFDAARSRCKEGVALFRQVGDRLMTAATIELLGWIAESQGDPVAARSLYEEALREYQFRDSKAATMSVTRHIAFLDYSAGDYGAARVCFEEALSYYRDMGSKGELISSLRGLGMTMLKLRDYSQAARLLRESLLLIRELQTDYGAAMGLAAWAAVLRARGELVGAAMLLGTVESEGTKPENRFSWLRVDFDKTLAAARAALGEEALAAAMAEGRAMTLKQAISYALEKTAQ